MKSGVRRSVFGVGKTVASFALPAKGGLGGGGGNPLAKSNGASSSRTVGDGTFIAGGSPPLTPPLAEGAKEGTPPLAGGMKSKAPLIAVALIAAIALDLAAAEPLSLLSLHLRRRVEVAPEAGRYRAVFESQSWDAGKTAIVVCDMWDKHWCPTATERVAEMAPRMNEVLKVARAKGVLIIHCPSDTLDFYKDHPGRKLAQQTPAAATKRPLERWCHLVPEKEGKLPIDDSDGGCDCGEPVKNYKAWSRQIAALEIRDGDAITDSAEAYNLMKQRGVENVIVMGVHTNMCVLGRPFSIRQMVYQGMNVALMRDLTDTMYNPEKSPFVSHFTGTDLVVEHIERHWCPTLVSGDFLDGKEFRFAKDTRPHVAIVSAEDEYKTAITLPKFAAEHLGKDFRVSFAIGTGPISRSKAAADDPLAKENIYNIPGLEILDDADVLLVSVRRRPLPKEQLDRFRQYVAAGKPVVGIRTASHPFHLRNQKPPEGLDDWPTFDRDVIGGNYSNHHGNDLKAWVWPLEGIRHPILEGIPAGELPIAGSLYVVSPISGSATELLRGRCEGIEQQEPVAWTHHRADGGKTFYTSLGHPDNFESPVFQRLLVNGIKWAAGRDDAETGRRGDAGKATSFAPPARGGLGGGGGSTPATSDSATAPPLVQDGSSQAAERTPPNPPLAGGAKEKTPPLTGAAEEKAPPLAGGDRLAGGEKEKTNAATSLPLTPSPTPRVPASWSPFPVPGTWDSHRPELKTFDGIAWYRSTVKVPVEWKNRALYLYVEKVDNACETFFNGVKIGISGTFPPSYTSGLASNEHRYVIPGDIVKFDGPNTVAIRVYDHDGAGGFKGRAPHLLGNNDAISMEGDWQFRTGDDEQWAKETLAAITPFEKIGPAPKLSPFATVIRRQAQDQPLSPQASHDLFKVPDDLAVDIVLTEPNISQPLFLNFDERGRMWVLNYLQYPEPAGLKLVSKDQWWRAVYDKVPEPPPHGVKGMDKITIHEDTDGDGAFDKHKTFVDGLNIATSFAHGRGGVFVLNPPYLLFYADKDQDDVPDGDPEVLLSGFGLEDTHSVVNSLRWGPDGWLYAAQGSTVSANVKIGYPAKEGTLSFAPPAKGGTGGVPESNTPTKARTPPNPPLAGGAKEGTPPFAAGANEKEKTGVFSQGQNIWRYHPELRKYEIFCEGGGNAFSCEIDAAGRVFSGSNGGNTRGFHYVQGGYCQKGFSKHGALSNPYSFGYFPNMEHGSYARFTHNFIVYEGDGLPAKYQGLIFGVNPMNSHVVLSERIPVGSTFKTTDVGFAIDSADSWFRPVDIKDGPDGNLYVADWYDGQLAHTANYQGGMDRERGRIYRIRAKTPFSRDPQGSVAMNLASRSPQELTKLLEHPNRWHRQTAQRLLADHPQPQLGPALHDQLLKVQGTATLETFWAMANSQSLQGGPVVTAVVHPDPHVRAWTWRLVFDHQDRLTDRLIAPFQVAVESESHIDVLCQIACSAKRIGPAEQALPIVRVLMTRSQSIDDPRFPLLVWWALERQIQPAREAVLALFDEKALWREPLVEKDILPRLMRRFAATGQRADLAVCAQLLKQSPSKEATAALMRGFEEAYQGRSLTNVPPELVAALSAAGGGSLSLKIRQNDAAAVAEALQILADEKGPANKRNEYALLVGETKQAAALPVLLDVLSRTGDDGLRASVLTALTAYNDDRIPIAVLQHYGQLTEDVRAVAQALLCSRKGWALQFAQAVDRGDIAKTSIPVETVRKLTIHRDDQLAALVHKLWGAVEGATTAEMQAQLERFTGVLADTSGDPYPGKKLYMQACGKCHKLHDQGGQIGPDLTTFKRDDVRSVLLNILNPSAEIREGFEMYAAVTGDGRVVTGFLVEQDPQVIVLRTTVGETVSLERDDLEEFQRLRQSPMPEGQLKELTDEQIRDLFAYLRSAQPLND
jgi:putative membrane-bound dehydrogenase-like protein